MKINSINNSQRLQQQPQNFKGGFVDFVAKNPELITGLAGASVIAQKVVMSGAEATIGPVMDIAVGKAVSKIANEPDDSFNQSSKVQAVRTTSQAVGGTIVGVIIRGACIAAATAFLAKAGAKVGEEVASSLAQKINPDKLQNSGDDMFKFGENAKKWGKSIGGAVATFVMLFTNFVIDAPFINWINGKLSKITGVDSLAAEKAEKGV